MLTTRDLKSFLLLRVGIPLGDRLFKTDVHNTLRGIEQMNHWSRQEIEDWQNHRLQALVTHFYTTTVYYKNLFNELGLTPDSIQTKEDLKKIPPITKDIIRKHYEELIPANIHTIPHKKASTGGSTGKPLKYLLDLKAWSYTTAVKIYSWQKSGYQYGDVYATVGSSSLFPQSPSIKHRLYHVFKSSVRISAMNLSDEKIATHVALLRRKKVRYIYGYAAGLYLIARYLNKHGIRIESIEGCFPTSEILTDEYRLEMEKAFGHTMDCYGARDGSMTAYEITPGHYHVGYNSLAEVVNCFKQDTGTLLVTDLLSYSFPFIRYELGDEVTLPQEQPTVPYNGQVITQIYGRTPDIIRLENGHVLTGVGFQVMFGRMNVEAYRISKIGSLKLLVEYQPTKAFTPSEEKLILQIFKNHAGADCEIQLKRVDEFQPNKNGKRNYFMA